MTAVTVPAGPSAATAGRGPTRRPSLSGRCRLGLDCVGCSVVAMAAVVAAAAVAEVAWEAAADSDVPDVATPSRLRALGFAEDSARSGPGSVVWRAEVQLKVDWSVGPRLWRELGVSNDSGARTESTSSLSIGRGWPPFQVRLSFPVQHPSQLGDPTSALPRPCRARPRRRRGGVGVGRARTTSGLTSRPIVRPLHFLECHRM